MNVTRTWKVWCPEFAAGMKTPIHYDWSKCDYSDGTTRIIDIAKSEENKEHVIVKITRGTAEACEKEMNAQLDDGIWEDCRAHIVEEII